MKNKAIEFSKQSIAQTQLIYYIKRDDEDKVIEKYLVGYFSLAQKIINVEKKALSNKLARRISRYSYYDAEKKSYSLPVILIGQLGKNYNDNRNKLISGKDLLNLAIVIQQNNNHYRAQISVMAISFKSYYNLKSTCCPIIFSLSV